MKRQYAIAIASFLGILALLIFFAWPRGSAPPERQRFDPVDYETRSKRKVTRLDPMQVAEEEYLPLEEDPTIPVVTTTCKWIVTDERRRVPQWVMLDNLRDRGQLFVEDDLRCLTAAGVSPAVLDFAERYQDANKRQGG